MKYEVLYVNSFLSHETFAECLDPCELNDSFLIQALSVDIVTWAK